MPRVRKATLLSLLLPLALCAGGRELSVVTLNLAKEPSAARMAAELANDRGAAERRRVPATGGRAPVGSGRPCGEARSACGRIEGGGGGPELGARDSLALPASRCAGQAAQEIRPGVPLRAPGTRSRPSRIRHGGRCGSSNTHLDTRINAADRVAQLEDAVRDLGSGPAIVGGDFNSNWFYWIEHVMPLPAGSQATRGGGIYDARRVPDGHARVADDLRLAGAAPRLDLAARAGASLVEGLSAAVLRPPRLLVARRVVISQRGDAPSGPVVCRRSPRRRIISSCGSRMRRPGAAFPSSS